MDGREGRYPTPLNVAEMAVEMPTCNPASASWTAPAAPALSWPRTAAHIFKKKLAAMGTTPEEATNEQIRQAQNETAAWAASNALGCDIDPLPEPSPAA